MLCLCCKYALKLFLDITTEKTCYVYIKKDKNFVWLWHDLTPFLDITGCSSFSGEGDTPWGTT